MASSSQMLAVGGGVGRVSQFGMITIFPASKLDPDWPSSTTTTMRHLTTSYITSRLHSNFDYIHLRYIPLHSTNSLNCILFYSGGKLCLLSLMRLIGKRKPIPVLHFHLVEWLCCLILFSITLSWFPIKSIKSNWFVFIFEKYSPVRWQSGTGRLLSPRSTMMMVADKDIEKSQDGGH